MINRQIQGLVLKDLLNLSHYKFSLIISLVMVIIFASTNPELAPILMLTMLGMMGLSTFNYDELSKSDAFILSMPTTKKEVVRAKYLLLILMLGVGVIISILLACIIQNVILKMNYSIQDILINVLAGLFGISLVSCIQIPSIYKYGSEKGRIQMFILVIMVFALLGGLGFLITKTISNLPIGGFLYQVKSWLPIIFIIFIVWGYYGSYRLSMKIYLKKEI